MYEYQKSLLYTIQSITGENTHDIMANLLSNIENHMVKCDFDPKLTPGGNIVGEDGWRSRTEKRYKSYMFYPGTNLYVGMYAVYRHSYRSDFCYFEKDWRKANKLCEKWKWVIKFSFKLPTSSIKMGQEEYDNFMTDGVILDASDDVDKPGLKPSQTKEEADKAKELSKEKQKLKRQQKRKNS